MRWPSKIRRTCLICYKEFRIHSARQKFCSVKCRESAIKKICKRCGKIFGVSKAEENKVTFCSVECKHYRPKSKCLQCGKIFNVVPTKFSKVKFCSVRCRGLAQRIKQCTVCGGERLPSGKKKEALCQLCKSAKVRLQLFLYRRKLKANNLPRELVLMMRKLKQTKEELSARPERSS